MLKKIHEPSNKRLTDQEMNVVAAQHVLKQGFRFINCVKGKINEDQNRTLMKDGSFDDMKLVKEFFEKRVGGGDDD